MGILKTGWMKKSGVISKVRNDVSNMIGSECIEIQNLKSIIEIDTLA